MCFLLREATAAKGGSHLGRKSTRPQVLQELRSVLKLELRQGLELGVG